jgi:hypothetical protein
VNDNDIATLAGAIDGDAPTAPTGLTASGNSETQINLTWVSSSDNLMVAGYKIYRDSGNGFVEIGRSSSNSYADSQGLILGVTYRYQLKAYDRAGNESGLSNTASAKPVKSVCVGQTNRVCTPESGNVEHVQAAINQAQDGDTVKLPAGSYTWTDGVTIIGKGIKIEGEGSGRVIARSTSSVSVGIGLKTFSTQIGLPLTIGQALEIERTGSVHSAGVPTGSRARMLGTVASYSGSSLTVNVTNIEGSGTHPLWIMSTSAQTTIINNSAPCSTPDQTQNCAMVKITEDDTHHVELSGIRFVRGTAIGNMFAVYPKAAGKPILVHDNYIEENNSLGNTAFFISTASGIFWRN